MERKRIAAVILQNLYIAFEDFAVLLGAMIKRQSGSHIILARDGWPNFVFAFHEREEIGPKMLARIARHTGLKPEDL